MRNFCLNLKSMALRGFCVVALIAAACENDDTHQCPEPPTVVDNGAPVQAGDPVEATLSIGIRTADNSVHTYAAQPRAGRSVDDLWILEYGTDGTCLAAKKIGAYTLGEEIKVDLIAGTGIDLYAIAGAGETSFEGLSLDELKAAHWGGESGTLESLPCSAHAQVDIRFANFASKELVLEHIGSEIKIAYIPDPTTPYEVSSYQLRNVPKKFHFISGAPVSAEDVEDKEIIVDNLGDTYTYIIPENLQGVDETIANAKDKKTDKPATYVEVKGAYEAPEIAMSYEVSWKMFLGENNTNDFNLLRNKRYSFVGNLRMEDETDHRADVDAIAAPYRQPESNCYMLTPDAAHALAIPVSRVNTFWKSVDSRNELYDGENDSPIQKWAVKVIWSDSSNELIAFEKSEGAEADEYFIVKPAGTGAEGNVVIGIYDATAGSDIDVATASPLWSWHIWVTAYNPGDGNWVALPEFDPSMEIYPNQPGTSTPNSYARRIAFPVANGKIYQYNSLTSTSNFGILTKGETIMDRNLGATSIDKAQFDKTVGLYYQWGRKDPFSAPNGDASGIDFSVEDQQTLAFAVQNPTKFICGIGNWLNTTDTKLWNEGSNYTPVKSIYDPCPAGWMLPNGNAYYPFTVGSSSNYWTASSIWSQPNLKKCESLGYATAQEAADAFDNGYVFWHNDLQVWFPAGGYINGKKVQEYKSWGKWWCNLINGSKGAAYRMQAYDATEDSDNRYDLYLCVNDGIGSNSSMSVAMPVRCVLEIKN